jgi:hypothetical protein
VFGAGPRPEKMPLPAVHDLPVEPPTGPAPRSPLRALLVAVGAFLLVLAVLWVIGRIRGGAPDPRLSVRVEPTDCPAGSSGSCYLAFVRNVGTVPLSPSCDWRSAASIDGGDVPSDALRPGEVALSAVVVVHGAATPSLACHSI